MPKISVIVPIYGVEKFIKKCAESLFAQTLDEIEFIFIDDCTPDRSMEILNGVIDNNRSRSFEMNWVVRTVRMPLNSGQAAVRKHGIQLATGQYMIHCDGDDWVEPKWLELLYNKAVKDNLDVVFCDYFRVINEKKEVCKNKCSDGCDTDYYIRRLLTKDCFTSVWNKLVKKDILQNSEFKFPQCNMWEDYYISIQYFYYANRIGYLNVPLYNYYCNNQSICYGSDSEKRLRQVVINCTAILSFLKEKRIDSLYNREIVVLKNNAKDEALSSYALPNFHKLWKEIYPEINAKYLFSRIVSLRDKLRFIIVLIGLYPTWIKYKL